MAKLTKLAGATSEIWQIFIQDSSSTIGAALTGLVFNTASLTAYYHRDTDTTATAITLVTMTVGTFTSSGFKEIDATNMPGWYQFCPPNAAIAASAKSCAFHLKGATNMAPLAFECQLVAYNPDDTVRLGLTALPNVASGSAGAIPTTGTGSNQISVSSGQVILQTGTGTGQLDFTSGIVKSNVTQLLGTAWLTPGTAGTPDVNVKLWNGLTTVALPLVPTTAGRTLDVSAGGEAGLDWANVGSPTTAVGLTGTTIATSQVVASVTGAVGSVTGAVGSVTGAVGSVTGNVGGSVASVVGLTASNLDTTVSSRMATYTQPAGFLAATFPSGTVANTTNITAGALTTVTNLTNAATAGDLTATMKASVVAAAWDTAIAGHVTAGSTGLALNAAGSAGDPWGTTLPGAYGAGTAGNILGNNLDATVSSVKSQTDKLTFTVPNVLDANIQAVNDVTVTGNGSAGTPWGP